MTRSNLQPRHVTIIETLRRGLQEGKVQEKAVAEVTNNTATDGAVLGSIIFGNYIRLTYVRQLDGIGISKADFQTLT